MKNTKKLFGIFASNGQYQSKMLKFKIEAVDYDELRDHKSFKYAINNYRYVSVRELRKKATYPKPNAIVKSFNR